GSAGHLPEQICFGIVASGNSRTEEMCHCAVWLADCRSNQAGEKELRTAESAVRRRAYATKRFSGPFRSDEVGRFKSNRARGHGFAFAPAELVSRALCGFCLRTAATAWRSAPSHAKLRRVCFAFDRRGPRAGAAGSNGLRTSRHRNQERRCG